MSEKRRDSKNRILQNGESQMLLVFSLTAIWEDVRTYLRLKNLIPTMKSLDK